MIAFVHSSADDARIIGTRVAAQTDQDRSRVKVKIGSAKNTTVYAIAADRGGGAGEKHVQPAEETENDGI